MYDKNLIGKLVISSNFGIGKIENVERVGDGSQLFLVVESIDHKLRNFIPIEDKTAYRFLADKNELDKTIENLKGDGPNKDFNSKKERINYFKDMCSMQDLDTISKLIKHLNNLSDRGSSEDQILNRLVENLALEHSVVNNVEIETSREFLSEVLEH